MSTAAFASDPKFWLTVTINVLNAYIEGDYDQEMMENLAIKLMAGCRPDGSLPSETLAVAAAVIDPEIVDNEEAFGQFAWLLDSAVDYFSAKSNSTY